MMAPQWAPCCLASCLVSLTAQVFQHALTIPIEEFDHPELEGLGVGTRLVPLGVDATLVLLGETTVLRVGSVPDPAQAIRIIVDAFHGILVNQPLGSNLSQLGAERHDPK